MAMNPYASKGAPSVRAAVMPRGKQPIKPKGGRIPGAIPTKPAPRAGIARPAVMPRKQAPAMKPMPVGKAKPGTVNMKPMPVGDKIVKIQPVTPGSKNKLKALPVGKNVGIKQAAAQMEKK